MDPQRRAKIIAESIKNLERFRDESLATSDRAWPDDAEARAADRVSSSCRSADPPLDPVQKWREDGERIEQMLAAGRAELRASERQHEQQSAEFWQAIDARVEAIISRNLEPVMEVLRDALTAVNEVNDAHENAFEQIDARLAALSKLLEQLRAGNESAQRHARTRAEAAEPLDLPPVPLVNKRTVN